MYTLSVVFKAFAWQSFREVIGSLFVGGTLENIENMIVYMFPEPVPFTQEILRSVGDSVICGKVISSLIVFEYLGVDSCSL